jgi:hypothetical protein
MILELLIRKYSKKFRTSSELTCHVRTASVLHDWDPANASIFQWARTFFGGPINLRKRCFFLCCRIDSQLIFFTGLIEMPGNIVGGTGFIAADITCKEWVIGIPYMFLARIAFGIQTISEIWVGIKSFLCNEIFVPERVSLNRLAIKNDACLANNSAEASLCQSLYWSS